MKILRSPRPVWLPSLVGLFVTVAGCAERDEIRTYTVAKEKASPSPAAPAGPASTSAKLGEPTDRMLAAIVPVGEQAWFFKLVGPVAAVDKRADEITKFFGTIRIVEGRPKWELPAGWKEEAGGGAMSMRLATLRIPSDGKPLEISVMQSGGDLLANVNRWRVDQMQLPPITAQQLPETTKEIKLGEDKATVVDLRGHFSGGTMMAPFAGGAGRATGQADLPPGHPPIDPALPPGHPPINSQPTERK